MAEDGGEAPPALAQGLEGSAATEVARDMLDMVVTLGAQQLYQNGLDNQLPNYVARAMMYDMQQVLQMSNVARDAGDTGAETLNPLWTSEAGMRRAGVRVRVSFVWLQIHPCTPERAPTH